MLPPTYAIGSRISGSYRETHADGTYAKNEKKNPLNMSAEEFIG
jgi:hypothetical protein